jgi:rare lipoprotein A
MNRMMPALQVASTVIAFALAALSGCASAPAPAPSPAPPARTPAPVPAPQQSEPRSAKGNPPFYEVLGKRYFVLPSAAGYQERGVASWYGPGFHTKQTSNGERFDMYAMTAAHKSLPLPSWVEVKNLRNGRSVTVRVNDRGPFKDGRIIDLSYSAAEKLDMLRDGTTFVEVRALSGAPPEQATAATLSPSTPLFIQAGAFQTEANANGLLGKLGREGLGNSFVRQDTVAGKTLFRVRIGPIEGVAEFDRLLDRLADLGVTDARLAND